MSLVWLHSPRRYNVLTKLAILFRAFSCDSSAVVQFGVDCFTSSLMFDVMLERANDYFFLSDMILIALAIV